jgi:hypothetical protein
MNYTLEQLREKFEYDPVTGNVFGLNWGSSRKRKLLTSLSELGYYRVLVVINGKQKALLLHRVGYELHTNTLLGTFVIDHIDHNKLNNKFSNLRRVTRLENNRNLGKRTTNTSGVSGVYQLPSGKWRAQVRVDGKNRHIGCFDTKEAAALAKINANVEYGFHPNHL